MSKFQVGQLAGRPISFATVCVVIAWLNPVSITSTIASNRDIVDTSTGTVSGPTKLRTAESTHPLPKEIQMKKRPDEDPLPPKSPSGDDGDNQPAKDFDQQDKESSAVSDIWQGIELFPDQYGEPCAIIPVEKPSPHKIFVWLRERACKRHVFRRFRDAKLGIPKPSDWREIRDLMELKADEEQKRIVHNRFAHDDDAIWIDLCDDEHRRVRIDRRGWEVVSDGGPVFARHKHQEALPEPVHGGTVAEFVDRISARSNPDDRDTFFDDNEFLTVVWVVSAMVQVGPTPILIFSSPKGSGKTTSAARIRDLLDPSKAPLQGEKTRRDLPLTLWHNAVPTFDNLTKLSKADSDTYCRAVTGTGQDRRKMFSDTDEIILQYRRPIIMTAIGMPSLEPDFLDRCVVLHADRLDSFVGERALKRDFDQARPRLLGALLDLVADVMKLLPAEPETAEPGLFTRHIS